MAFNVRSGGKATNVPVPDTVVSGDLVRVGEIVGIAEYDARLGEDGNTYVTLALEGIGHRPIDAGESVAVGDALYTTDAGPGAVDITTVGGTGAKPVGYATRDKSADNEVWFKLVPTVGEEA